MKRLLSALLSLLVCIGHASVAIDAKENQPADKETVLQFRDFQYITNEIANDSIIVYSSDKKTETYTVSDRQTGKVTNVYTVSVYQNFVKGVNDIHTAFFTADKTISGQGQDAVTIRFTASVEIYRSGSFRSFQGVNYTTVGIVSAVTPMIIISSQSEAHSPTHSFPSTELNYSYTVNVATTGTVSINITPILISAGFSYTTYYYRIINGSGTFRLYN